MRELSVFGLAVAALLVAGPAFAFRTPDTNAPVPTPHQRELGYADQERQPYAMSYSDEAARSLGLTDGRLDVFSSQPAAGATLKGGFDTHGAVLRLQW